MTNKLNSIKVPRRLVQGGMTLFSKREFQRLFQVSEPAARFFLFHHCRTGLFVRLKNGLYALSSHFPSEEEIANRLYQPSYLSFEYVLARHGVIPEAVYSLTSATTKSSRRFEVEGKAYEYSTIKKQAFIGYRQEKRGKSIILVASPEKAFVDTLYLSHLKKRHLSERLDVSRLSKDLVLKYADLFGRPHFVEMARSRL